MTRNFIIEVSINTNFKHEAENKIKKMLADNNIEKINIKCLEKRRTNRQNAALHLWFTLLATSLNDKHIDMRALIKKDIEMRWSGYAIKEYLFKPLLKAKFGKKTTTQLTTKELNDIFDIITKVIAERTNGECEYIPFPSFDNLYD